MKKVGLVILAAVALNGCASMPLQKMPDQTYNFLAMHEVFVPKCVQAGYISTQEMTNSIIDDNYIKSTWIIDDAKYSAALTLMKNDNLTVIDDHFCTDVRIGIAKTAANVRIDNNKRQAERERMSKAADEWNRSIQANKPTYCTHNVIGNSIYSTCN